MISDAPGQEQTSTGSSGHLQGDFGWPQDPVDIDKVISDAAEQQMSTGSSDFRWPQDLVDIYKMISDAVEQGQECAAGEGFKLISDELGQGQGHAQPEDFLRFENHLLYPPS
jgi:hypothetical protein